MDEEFTVEYYVASIAGGCAPGTMEEDGSMQQGTSAPSSPVAPTEMITTPTVEPATPTSSATAGVELCTPSTDASTMTDEAPHRYRTVPNTLATTSPILDFDYGDECLMAVEEPASFVEAKRQSYW
ncbi:hypothetical protein E2562_025103 [Oryza meyeriana var. granulata]|uniref:Uncharacterized protein n=1 Tax=Oryza meyeriana var. granulata TaxID=110450 RepID=A0A6G1CH76_9ORYZ|nr:hypothetical protein E2562_025103 [Oryza meyeriana var. granulata]